MVIIVTNQGKNTSWCTFWVKPLTSARVGRQGDPDVGAGGGDDDGGGGGDGDDDGDDDDDDGDDGEENHHEHEEHEEPYIGSANVHEALSLMTMTDDTHTYTYRDDHMFDMSVLNCKELQSCFTETLSGNFRNPNIFVHSI